MREILFRGRRLYNGEWVEGDLIQLHDGRKYIVNDRFGACIDDKGNFINTEEPFVCQVDPATVGQHTGLKDKNRKRIFEGDIVREIFEGTTIEYEGDWSEFREEVDFHGNKIGTVTFTGTGTHLKATHGELWVNGEAAEDWKPSRRTRLTACRCEVIGNIHDNPELVKQV